MAISYQRIAREVALRANQIGASVADASAFDTAYQVSGSSMIDGTDLPYTALKDTIIASEAFLTDFIGRTNNTTLQSPLLGTSSPLLSGAAVPAYDDSSWRFVGSILSVRQDTTLLPLTEKTKQEVIRVNESGIFKREYLYYAIDGGSIYHTCTTFPEVKIMQCTFDRATAESAFAAGSSRLSESLELLWVAHVLTSLPQETWFVPTAGYYAQIVEQGLSQLAQGAMPSAAMVSDTQNSDPIKD